MSMNYVENVTAYYVKLIDEDDPTFFASPECITALGIGYDEFRRRVSDIDSTIFGTSVQITTTGTGYNLGSPVSPVRIMGLPTNLTGPRVSQLLKVAHVDTGTGVALSYLVPAGSMDELNVVSAQYKYFLYGTVLHISRAASIPLRLEYIPVSIVDWSRSVTGNNEWIDELVEFHDVIALLAYANYASVDGYQSPEVDALLARRLQSLQDHLQGRVAERNRFVKEIW